MLLELDSRTSIGFEVSLLWERGTDALCVDVLHTATGERLSFPTTPARAADDFMHPFASLLDAELPAARAA